MRQELLIYGLKEGEPSYMETLLAENIFSWSDAEKIKEAARKDGFVKFRVVPFTLEMPDFTKAINI